MISCRDTGGRVEGSVSRGIFTEPPRPADSSFSWDFLAAGDYTHDNAFIEISGNKARLKTVNTTFDDAAGFDGGNHAGTAFTGGALKLQTSMNALIPPTSLPESGGLYGYWTMEGNWADSSGHGRTLLPTGGVGWNGNAKAGDQAAFFDGAGGFVSLPDPVNLGTGRPFTISLWVYVAANDTNPRRFFNWGLSDGNGRQEILCFTKFYTPDHRINCELWRNNVNSNSGSTMSLAINAWHHLVVTSDGTNVRTYLNGVKFWTRAHNILDVAAPLRFGADLGGSAGGRLNGNIDNLAVWTTSLSDAQVFSLYAANSPFTTELSSAWTPHWSQLTKYWKMDGNWLDSLGTGSGATLTGTPTFVTGKIGTQAALFSGSGQSVNLGTVNAFSLANRFSYGAWVRPDALTDLGKFIELRASGVLRVGLGMSGAADGGNDDLNVIVANGAVTYGFTNSNLLKTGVWSHVMVVFDGTRATDAEKLKLYFDGRPVPLNVVGPLPSSTADMSSAGLEVGAVAGAHWLTGAVDDLAVWSAPLSASDVALIYERQKQKYAGSYESPVIDMGAAHATWPGLTGRSSLPFFKELTTVSETAAHYPQISGSLAQDLLALWRFNGPTGTVSHNAVIANEIPAGPTGSLKDPDSANKARYAPGILGNSLQLDGVDDYIDLGQNLDFEKTDAFSIAGWVYADSSSSSGMILSKMRASGDYRGWSLAYGLSGTGIELILRDTWIIPRHLVQVRSTTPLPTGAWVFVASTYDGSSLASGISLYVNGKPQVTTTTNDSLSTGGSIRQTIPLNIGARDSGRSPIFQGRIDELAVWGRVLSATEILELYRRGANRVKYHVRSCADPACQCKSFAANGNASSADCDGNGIPNENDPDDSHKAEWIGPGGTAATAFSELQNNTSVDAAGLPNGEVRSGNLNLDWSGSFFPAAARPVPNRYFRYRVSMESDDENKLCSGSPCLPDVTAVTVGPAGRFYGGSPSLVNNTPLGFSQLRTMTDSAASCTSYQVSTDEGGTWQWWNGSAWAPTTAGVVTSNPLSDFTSERLQSLSGGSFKFKAFLNPDTAGLLTQGCELNGVGVTYKP